MHSHTTVASWIIKSNLKLKVLLNGCDGICAEMRVSLWAFLFSTAPPCEEAIGSISSIPRERRSSHAKSGHPSSLMDESGKSISLAPFSLFVERACLSHPVISFVWKLLIWEIWSSSQVPWTWSVKLPNNGIHLGVHRWLSRLSAWLLISAQVMIPGLWNWAPRHAPRWVWSLLKISVIPSKASPISDQV